MGGVIVTIRYLFVRLWTPGFVLSRIIGAYLYVSYVTMHSPLYLIVMRSLLTFFVAFFPSTR